MKIPQSDIEKRYSGLSVYELARLYRSGDLTEMAQSVLKNEIEKRGLTEERMLRIKAPYPIKAPPKTPKKKSRVPYGCLSCGWGGDDRDLKLYVTRTQDSWPWEEHREEIYPKCKSIGTIEARPLKA